MAEIELRDSSSKDSENKTPSFISNAEQAEVDIGYFEQKLEEFKLYFSENHDPNKLNQIKVKRNPKDDYSRISTMITIYEFILSKNKEMLHAINKERSVNQQYKNQLPLLIERLQCLSEACIKKEEMIKTTGEYMQDSENQIYELKEELREKEDLIRQLNFTVSEQREKLDSRYDASITSFDSKNDSRIAGRGRNTAGDTSFHNDGDIETIQELNDDI